MVKLLHVTLFVLLLVPTAFSQSLSKKQLDKWLNDPDAPIPAIKQRRKINEGKLTFLDPDKHKRVMHSENKIHITASSLKTGWVELHQCYHQLDAFPRVQVVYKYRNIRHLKIVSFTKMNSAKIEGKSVQLINVKQGASLCVTAQIQSLQQISDGYQLKNGPFRRKFLDGYFPLRVSVTVNFSKKVLQLAKVTPRPVAGKKQPGLQLFKSPNKVRLDAIFEGVLNTRMNFRLVSH